MDNHLHEFMRITIFRMCEHYLPKLKITLDDLNNEVLWKHETEKLNSIGGIMLHVAQHIQRHVIRYSSSDKADGGIENHFPDETTLFSSDLIQLITDRFSTWREVMTDYLEGNMEEKNSTCMIFII